MAIPPLHKLGIAKQIDPFHSGLTRILSDSRHESDSTNTNQAVQQNIERNPNNEMQQDIEVNGTKHLDIKWSYDKFHDVTFSSHTHNDEENQNNEINQILSHWHDNTQNQCMFDLDRVAHTLLSSSTLGQQQLDTVNESPVSNTTFIERSLETETLFPLQVHVSLPAVSDLPGFDDLDQTGDSPPIMPDDHTPQWTTSMPNDGPTLWYTPPQTPPCDDPEICAMEPSLDLPHDSLCLWNYCQPGDTNAG